MTGLPTIDERFTSSTIGDNGESLPHCNDETVTAERIEASPVPPMWRCKRRHIPAASFIRHDNMLMHEVTRDMRDAASDNSFEVVYDRATTTDCARSGHHGYRVIRYGGSPSDDILQLEFSCKKDFTRPWHPDNAREPGFWIVEHFKKMDKSRRLGDKAHIEEEISKELETANEDMKAGIRKEEIEKAQHMGKEIHTYARKNRMGRTVSGAKK